MAQPEARLARKIMAALRAEGIFCFKVHGGPHMMQGLPDIIACVGGAFVGYEVKVPGRASRLRPAQPVVHGMIRASGGEAHVVTSIEQALRIAHDVLDQLDP